MRSFRVLLSVSVLLLAFTTTATSLAQTPQNPQTTYSLYLPILVEGNLEQEAPTSFELIDRAISAGTLDPETGLIYKVFSTFEDPRLPEQYAGNGAGKDGDLIMDEVASQAAMLSEGTKQILTPFFVPPTYPGSWYSLVHPASKRVSPDSANADWDNLTAVGGKLKIWYPTFITDGKTKAEGLRTALDTKIWQTVLFPVAYDQQPVRRTAHLGKL